MKKYTIVNIYKLNNLIIFDIYLFFLQSNIITNI